MIRICIDINTALLPSAGQTVAMVREEMSRITELQLLAPAEVNGRVVPDQQILRDGDRLDLPPPEVTQDETGDARPNRDRGRLSGHSSRIDSQGGIREQGRSRTAERQSDLSTVPTHIQEAIDLLLRPYGVSLELLVRKAEAPAQRYRTTTEAGENMRISRSTVSRHVNSGDLPAIQCGGRLLFDTGDIDELLLSRESRGGHPKLPD